MGRGEGLRADPGGTRPTVAQEQAAEELADVFSALSNPTRILMLLYLVRGEYTNQELLDAMGHPQISLWRNLETLHEAALVKKKPYSRQEIGYIANTERLEELSLLLHQLVEAAIESPTHQVDIEALSDPLQYALLAALGLPIKEEERIG